MISTERKVCNRSLKIKVKVKVKSSWLIFSIGIYINGINIKEKVKNFKDLHER